MNSLSMCSVVFIVANAILWVQKFQRLSDPQPNGQRLCTGQVPADQIPHTARIMANGDQLYRQSTGAYEEVHKEDGTL